MSAATLGRGEEAALARRVRRSGSPDGERRGECMNNEEAGVDFLLLPQPIKDPEYWI